MKEEPTSWYTDNEADKFPHTSTSLEFGVGSGGEGVAGAGGGGGAAEYPSGGGGGDGEGGGGGRGTSAVVWNMVQSQLLHHNTQPTTSTMPPVSVAILSIVVNYNCTLAPGSDVAESGTSTV